MTDEASPAEGSAGAPRPDDWHLAAIRTRLGSTGPATESADRERAEPPPGLWDRIAGTTADIGPPGSDLGAGDAVQYSIDASDVVVDVDAGWRQFAHDNDAPELADPHPTRTLWDHFTDEQSRDLWRAVVSRVRATGTEAHVPFRCDGPDARRWFEMTVTPQRSGRVRFRSVLVFEDARPTVGLLARDAPRDRDAAAVDLCSWCARGLDDSRWVAIDQLVLENRLLEEPPMPHVSHGICPDCRTAMSSEAERVDAEGSVS